MKRIISGIIALTLMTSLGFAGASCESIVQAKTGTIEIRVTDKPLSYGDIEGIWVTIDTSEDEGVVVHKAVAEQEQLGEGDQNQVQNQVQQGEGEWISIPITGDNPFELLELKEKGVDELLGWADVLPGKYTQIRMSILEVNIKFNGDTNGDNDDMVPAKLPSGKLKFVRPFDVVAGATTILELDFIADESVVITGKGDLIFKPVVKLSVFNELQPVELGITGNANAEWSTTESHTGKYSIHLQTLGTPGGHEVEGDGVEADEARIVFPLPEGTTLGDIESISWWEYLVQGYPPHVDIMLDFDDDDVADDSVVFENAYNSEDHYNLEAPMPYGAATGDWYQTFDDDDLGPFQIDDEANGWLASGPPGPLGDENFIYHTLEEWKDGVDVNGDTSTDISSATLILALEIEVDNWVVQSEAYVDDIVVNYTE